MKKEKYRVRFARVFQGFRDSWFSLKMGLLRPAKFENQCSVDLENVIPKLCSFSIPRKYYRYHIISYPYLSPSLKYII